MVRYAVALIAATLLFCSPATASAPAVPAPVLAAAQTALGDNAGAIVHERHISVSAVAGPARFTQQNDAVLLMVDGAYRHIHFSKIVENGHTLSAEEVAKRENENNAQFERGDGFFKQPYDKRYLADYAYDVVPQCTCPSGQTEVHFSTTMHDAQHGEGTMRIDQTTGHVIEVRYTPFVFPDHANAGTTTETFGEPIAGLWTIVRIDREYTGRVLFVPGHGTATETLDHFRRFADPEAGVAFYRSATL
jgi:hypothetical protein